MVFRKTYIMRRFLLLALIILNSVGCSTIPFQRTSYFPLDSVDLQLARREFATSLPDRFQVMNTIVFQYKWHSFSALGYIDVNRGAKTFAVSCMNPAGIKLFELSGDKDSVKTNFVLKELLRRGIYPWLWERISEEFILIMFLRERQKRKKTDTRLFLASRAVQGSLSIYSPAGDPSLLKKDIMKKPPPLECFLL